MQQSSTEVELGKLADLCSSLRLQDAEDNIAGHLLDPIAASLGAESAAFRHLDLRHSRPRILNLTSIGVARTVSDDYLAHFHRFDPFLDRLAEEPDRTDTTTAFPLAGKRFQSYYREFLEPNGLVHHAGFMLRDRPGHQAWIFNFHRRASAPDFSALELARSRLIQACLQGQAGRQVTVAASRLTDLTSREREVVMAVEQGLANKEIAARLLISPRTVENHLRNIYEKLRVNTRTQLLTAIHAQDYSPDRTDFE